MQQGRLAYLGIGTVVGLLAGTGYWKGYQRVELPQQTQEETEDGHLFKYGRPELPVSLRSYTSHTVLYDHCRKVPLWSAEVITPQSITGSGNRRYSNFQPDPAVPEGFSSSNADYRKSGWSRGHMTPAADCRHCQEAMDDSHYLTNIVPQDFDNNSNYWNRLEIYCRRLTKKYPKIHIISGPLYLPTTDQDGKKYVKYQVIGGGDVAVPSHLYKIVLAEMENGGGGGEGGGGDEEPNSSHQPRQTMGVFVVPNKPLGHEPLTSFQTTLHGLETLSGISFHPRLDRKKVADLCETDSCNLMTLLELKQYIYTKRLQGARNEEQIEKILADANKEGMGEDAVVTEQVTQRRNEL